VLVLALALAVTIQAAPSCPEGWEAVPARACLLRGERPGLVVYLHGLGANRFAVTSEWSVLAEVPRARRQSVLALWGQEGLCDWAPEALCWPSDRAQLDELKVLEARLAHALEATWTRLRHRWTPVFAGYSNGGYCVSLLMGDSEVSAAAWALLQGGPVTGTPYPRTRERPTWLLAAAEDPIQGPSTQALKTALESAGWHPRLVVRPGQHPAEVGDYQRLFDFVGTVVPR
jgi:predicted esterase